MYANMMIISLTILDAMCTCARLFFIYRLLDQREDFVQKRLIYPILRLLASLDTKMDVFIEFSVPKNPIINQFQKMNTSIEAETQENMCFLRFSRIFARPCFAAYNYQYLK